MKKSELIQAIREALLPEIEKIVSKKVALAAAKIIKENRKVRRTTTPSKTQSSPSLAQLMNEQPVDQQAPSKYKSKDFTKNGILNDILNETAQQTQEYKSMGGGEYTSNMAQNFASANPATAFNQEKPSARQMLPDDRQGRDIPDALAAALTKDYSSLVKSPSFNKRNR